MTGLLSLAFLIIYGGGIWKFWQGFERTSFDRSFSSRLKMSLLWPALIFNKSYRQNFTKALKGSNKGY
jgi:predicted permease